MFNIGDTVQFTGTKFFAFPTALGNGTRCVPCKKAVITKINAVALHQFHIIAEDPNSARGWVNADDIKESETADKLSTDEPTKPRSKKKSKVTATE